MPRMKKPDDQRAASFGVTLPQGMWAQIDKDAAEAGLNRSQWVKQCYERTAPTPISIYNLLTDSQKKEVAEVARRSKKSVLEAAAMCLEGGIAYAIGTMADLTIDEETP